MSNLTHFILVDFQNVTKVDLDRLMVGNVVLLLFLGENQKKLSATLEKQIIRHPAEVRLIKVGETTPNALDKKLAGYLGSLGPRHPEARYHIISQDKDYDVLVSYLMATGLNVARYGAFEDLPIIAPKKSGVSRAPFAPAKPAVIPATVVSSPIPKPLLKTKSVEDKMEKLIKHLLHAHPPTSESLKKTINHHYNSVLPKGGMKGVINALKERGIVVIDDKGRVSCPPQS